MRFVENVLIFVQHTDGKSENSCWPDAVKYPGKQIKEL